MTTKDTVKKELSSSSRKLTKALDRVSALREEQTVLIKVAVDAGVSMPEIGRLTGVSKSRIWQIKNDYKGKKHGSTEVSID